MKFGFKEFFIFGQDRVLFGFFVKKVVVCEVVFVMVKVEFQDDGGNDFCNIEGVVSLEIFKVEFDLLVNEEDCLMEGFFVRLVYSVLEYDKIMNGKKIVRVDKKMIQQEVNRIVV